STCTAKPLSSGRAGCQASNPPSSAGAASRPGVARGSNNTATATSPPASNHGGGVACSHSAWSHAASPFSAAIIKPAATSAGTSNTAFGHGSASSTSGVITKLTTGIATRFATGDSNGKDWN